MTSEEKVKRIHPEAFCLREGPGVYWIIRKEGAIGSLIPRAYTKRSAWAAAARQIKLPREARA